MEGDDSVACDELGLSYRAAAQIQIQYTPQGDSAPSSRNARHANSNFLLFPGISDLQIQIRAS